MKMISGAVLMVAVLGTAQALSAKEILARGPLTAEGQPAGRAHTGLLVQDAASGQTVLAVNDAEAYTPASSLKVLTTAAALYTLGAQTSFKTSVLMPAATGGQVPRLTLRGGGDPELAEQKEQNSLETLAKAVADKGVKSIAELRVDDRLLNWPRWGNGWMWDDTEFPIGALYLDGDTAPYGEMVLDDDEVKAGRQPNPTLITDPAALPLEVGNRFKALLAAAGVQVTGEVKLAGAEPGDSVAASVQSAPIARLLSDTNKYSVNIYAEQLYAALGVGKDGTPGTPERSATAMSAFLKTAGTTDAGTRLRDGSGLSRYNLLTPAQLVAVLRYAYLNPVVAGGKLSPEDAYTQQKNLFIESLPVAGTGDDTPEGKARGGTLRKRLIGSNLDLRAKTGSMTGVSSLSGYLRAKSGKLLVFSLLMDNYPGSVSDLNRWQDEVVVALAAEN